MFSNVHAGLTDICAEYANATHDVLTLLIITKSELFCGRFCGIPRRCVASSPTGGEPGDTPSLRLGYDRPTGSGNQAGRSEFCQDRGRVQTRLFRLGKRPSVKAVQRPPDLTQALLTRGFH